LKFMGCDVVGHMANQVVVDLPKASGLTITSPDQPGIPKDRVAAANHIAAAKPPNRPVAYDSVEVLITNYEPQRAKPAPWGLDFQWLFAAAGYGEADLSSQEFEDFVHFATRFDCDLLDEDWKELLPHGPVALPFPYIAGAKPLTQLTPINDVDSRPVCVPALNA
jgi:hypothetical protein